MGEKNIHKRAGFLRAEPFAEPCIDLQCFEFLFILQVLSPKRPYKLLFNYSARLVFGFFLAVLKGKLSSSENRITKQRLPSTLK